MYCASICSVGAADDSGEYHRIDHLSAPDLDGDSQNIRLELPCLFCDRINRSPPAQWGYYWTRCP